MYNFTKFALSTALLFSGALAAEFCYRDSEGCGPGTEAWPPVCHSGTRQSPIDIPIQYFPTASVRMNLGVYKGSYFNLKNNGHSVEIDFDGQGPHTVNLPFPDPLNVTSRNQGQRQYRFASAHFHWGTSDKVGSEHSFSGRSSAMELHLVHFLANYSSVSEALNSGDESALAVIGVLIDMSSSRSSSALAPIANSLSQVTTKDESTSVQEPLDLSKIIGEGGSTMYTYKGSLTTPDCQEQVNWFVFANPAKASKQETQAFRSMVMDGRGELLDENHRPVQKLSGRKVNFARVSSTSRYYG